MEEFDIELDSDIGTSISKIKNKELKQSETDIDYDKVMEILHNSETKNSNIHISNSDKFNTYVQDIRPKREINMNQFVKNIETNLDNFNKININEPLPLNFTKNMDKYQNNIKF